MREPPARVLSRLGRRLFNFAAISGLAVLVGFVAPGGVSSMGTADPSRACALSWTVVPSPVVSGGELFSVAADAPDDAWAVGGPSFAANARQQGLIEHWDGSRWSVVRSPAVDAVLLGVALTDADDAWAVGKDASSYWTGESSHAFAVAEHWNGKRWRRVPVVVPPERPARGIPPPTPGVLSLAAVAETSATDVWAVGADESDAAVVLHWDGSRWQVRLRLPDDELLAVAALSPNDLWVGGSESAKKIPRYLELHWNGKRWSRYSQPSSADDQGAPEVVAIGASSSGDVWAAGHEPGANGDGPGYAATVLLHWNGTGWRNVATPQNRFVNSLAVRAPHDITISGVVGDGDAYGGPFLERRVGGKWQDTKLASGEALHGLAADQQQGLWGVGFTGSRFDPSLGFPQRSQPLVTRAACV